MVVRRLWEAAARGDPAGVTALYQPWAVVRAGGHSPLAGEFKGSDVIVDYFGRIGEMVDDLRSELLDVYTSDEGAVMRYRTVADRGPHHLDMEFLFVAKIAGGRILEADLIPADQQRYDAFWA
jgi:ketosteroid isomerase-like protein